MRAFLIAAGIAVLFMSGGAKTEGIMSGPCIGCAEGIYNVRAASAPVCPAPTVTAVSPNTGSSAGGTPVTITGTNFTGATNVNFGLGNAAVFTVTNPTTIAVASSPSGSVGTVDVTVTTSCGVSTISAADQYTYMTISAGITFVSNNSNSTPAASYTFTSQNIGAADATRIIAVGVAHGPNALQITSMTIQGISATQAPSAAQLSGAGSGTDIWYAPVPTGTTGTIVINLNGGQSRASIFVYRIVGAGVAFSSASGNATTTGSGPLAASLTVPSSGGSFGIVSAHNAGATPSSTNLTLDSTPLVVGSSTQQSGVNTSATGSTSFNFSWGVSTDAAMSVATFSP